MDAAARPDLAKLRELLAKATPGPWFWDGQVGQYVNLATVGRGVLTVMGTKRLGMNGSEPVFYRREPDSPWGWNGKPEPASKVAVREVPYRNDIVDIDNPNAQLIVAAVNALPELLSEIESLRRVRDAAQAIVDDVDPNDPMDPVNWSLIVALNDGWFANAIETGVIAGQLLAERSRGADLRAALEHARFALKGARGLASDSDDTEADIEYAKAIDVIDAALATPEPQGGLQPTPEYGAAVIPGANPVAQPVPTPEPRFVGDMVQTLRCTDPEHPGGAFCADTTGLPTCYEPLAAAPPSSDADPRDTDRTRIREAFVQIADVDFDDPGPVIGILDAALGATPYVGPSSDAGSPIDVERLRDVLRAHGWYLADVVTGKWVESSEWVPVLAAILEGPADPEEKP